MKRCLLPIITLLCGAALVFAQMEEPQNPALFPPGPSPGFGPGPGISQADPGMLRGGPGIFQNDSGTFRDSPGAFQNSAGTFR
jgi:hypothetical protein